MTRTDQIMALAVTLAEHPFDAEGRNGCNIKEPKRIPTRLLPGQRCKVCGYIDRRPSIPHEASK